MSKRQRKHPIPTAAVALAQPTHDPFAVLSDLEVSLVLGYLSVEQKLCARRVSTLWRDCVDFRLTKSAIGRNFPGAPEAHAVYANWKEEALAFRKLASLYATRAKPSIARQFYLEGGGKWCICNHHLVWTAGTCINFQQLWDPNEPGRSNFPVSRKNITTIKFDEAPRNIREPKVEWMAGDNETGVVILYVGAPASSRKWLLAISATTEQVLWRQKHDYKLLTPTETSSKADPAPISFGHGKLIFTDSGRDQNLDYPDTPNRPLRTLGSSSWLTSTPPTKHLVIMDILTGQESTRAEIPSPNPNPSPGPNPPVVLYDNNGDCYAAHPTKEVYLVLTGAALSIFSTKTGGLLHKHSIPRGDEQSQTRRQWEASYFHFAGSGKTWLMLEEGITNITSYELDAETFGVGKRRAWNIESPGSQIRDRLNMYMSQLDPTTRTAYIRCRAIRGRIWGWEVVRALAFDPVEGTPNFKANAADIVTLPPKKRPGRKRRVRPRDGWLPQGRRELEFEVEWGDCKRARMVKPYLVLGSADCLSDQTMLILGFITPW